MLLNIKVKYQSIYGKNRFKPKNEDALFLTKILGKRTLSAKQIQICKDYGHKVEIEELNQDEVLKF